MSKKELLVVNVGGKKRAIIPVVEANFPFCQDCGYYNGGICLRKPNIISNSVGRGVDVKRNCKKMKYTLFRYCYDLKLSNNNTLH